MTLMTIIELEEPGKRQTPGYEKRPSLRHPVPHPEPASRYCDTPARTATTMLGNVSVCRLFTIDHGRRIDLCAIRAAGPAAMSSNF